MNTQDKIGDVVVFQPSSGYRFSIDSLLLADFAKPRNKDKILDLGCGCGIISLLLAKKLSEINIIGIEIQESLAELAKQNVTSNHLNSKIEIILGDIKNIKQLIPAGNFDYIISNPPFRPAQAGRICPNLSEAIARHEIKVNLDDILNGARYGLRSGGKLAVIYPAELTAKLIKALCEKKLEPKRIQFVHPSKEQKARMVMIEACKDGGVEVKILKPIFLDSHYLQGGRQTFLK